MLGSSPYLGTGNTLFTVRQFMILLDDVGRVNFLINYLESDTRKPATDVNNQMKGYWLDGRRDNAVRPRYDVLKAYIVFNLFDGNDRYTFAETAEDGFDLEMQYPDLMFQYRLGSTSDDIRQIGAYLKPLQLGQMAYVISNGDEAHVRISSNSP